MSTVIHLCSAIGSYRGQAGGTEASRQNLHIKFKQVLMFYHLKTRRYVNTVYTHVSKLQYC